MRVNLFVATASLLAYTGLAMNHHAETEYYEDLAQSIGEEFDYDLDLAETYGIKVNSLSKKVDLSKGKKSCSCCKHKEPPKKVEQKEVKKEMKECEKEKAKKEEDEKKKKDQEKKEQEKKD